MLSAASSAPSAKAIDWTQWGGPYRNFHTEAAGIKDTWPATGPRVIWKRPLGEGYSSPAVENGVLYTMYGKPREEVVIASDAETGKTLWEHSTPMTFQSDASREMGNGPYSTPLVVADRVFTTGVDGRLQCLDKKTGKPLWTQQLWKDHGGSQLMYGYSSSAIAFRQLVIVPVGGRGKAVMAFNQSDGKVAWAKNDLGNVYSSPVLIDVGGLEQLVVLLDGALVGLNPHNGDLQWKVPFTADYSIAVATPVWGPGNLLFVSSEYGGGSKVIELRRERLADDSHGTMELESAAAPSRQRRPHRRHALLFERREGQPGDPQRRRCPQRQHSLAAAQHREGDLRVGGPEADHARSGRHPHDRAPVAEGLRDHCEGAAVDEAFVDAAGARWHEALPQGSADHDGAGPQLKTDPPSLTSSVCGTAFP